MTVLGSFVVRAVSSPGLLPPGAPMTPPAAARKREQHRESARPLRRSNPVASTTTRVAMVSSSHSFDCRLTRQLANAQQAMRMPQASLDRGLGAMAPSSMLCRPPHRAYGELHTPSRVPVPRGVVAPEWNARACSCPHNRDRICTRPRRSLCISVRGRRRICTHCSLDAQANTSPGCRSPAAGS
jgi:hypothetical protein